MSTGLQTFFVYAPDYTDEGTFQRRLEVRKQHQEKMMKSAAAGTIKFGGAFVDPETVDSDEKKLIGSGGIFQAASLEEVKKLVESDVYWTGGVWDKEKTIILPFLAATPMTDEHA